MLIVSLNRIEKRKVAVFLTCLLIAVLTWLFFALSNTYPYKVKSKVNFVNPPLNKAYDSLQEGTVMLSVEGTGWQLLFSKLRLSPKVVDVSLKNLNNSHYIRLSSQLRDINLQFESNQKIVSANPDTLFFDFSKRIIKRVPIKFLYKIDFKKAFGVSSEVKLEPATVLITGAAADLEKIDFWYTDTLRLSNISSEITTKIGFQNIKGTNIDVYPKHVKVYIPVEEFTEKTLEIPLKITNNSNKEIKLIPEKVKVTFLTALGNYPKIERDSIIATVDLNNWLKNSYSQLPVSLTQFPAFSKLVRIEPQIVDFLIKD